MNKNFQIGCVSHVCLVVMPRVILLFSSFSLSLFPQLLSCIKFTHTIHGLTLNMENKGYGDSSNHVEIVQISLNIQLECGLDGG